MKIKKWEVVTRQLPFLLPYGSRVRRELSEKFDIVEAGAYRNSMSKFNGHGFTSTVEYIAIRRAEIQTEYEERGISFKDIPLSPSEVQKREGQS